VKPAFVSRKGVIASEHPFSSIAGLSILEKGGNAIDAAVATSFMLAVSQPALNGLGGDFMAMIYNEKSGKVEFINGSGWAPRQLTKELIIEKSGGNMPRYGPLSIVVPGMVMGAHSLWKQYGSMEWQDLLRPAVQAAMNGLPVSPRLELTIKGINESSHDNETTRTYAVPRWGRINMQRLANTIQAIGENGPSFFYREVGRAITDYVNSMGGVFSYDDFTEYLPEWREPLSIEYRGVKVYESPPNSQGITTLLILKEIERSNVALRGSSKVKEFIEIYKHAYSIRDSYIGDPKYVDIPINKILDEVASSLSNMKRLQGGDTTNFVVADAEGNIVSAIQSLYHPFGSRITEPTYQVTLNNRASDFKMSGPNELGPHKRPLHTLSSIIVEKSGKPMLALGISGGHFRPQQHAMLLTNIIDLGMDVVEAIDAPRFLWDGAEVFAEDGVDAEVRKIKYPGATGVAHAIQFINDEKVGYADIRGDGVALGQY